MIRKQSKQHELYDLCNNAKKNEDASYDKLRHWLNFHRDDKNRLENAANYKDKDNRTALHLLLKKNPPLDIVERLMEISPNTVQIKNSYYGMIPLHYASMGGASLEVIQRLVQESPETVQVKDSSGWLPLHYACRYRASLDVLNFLVNIYPDGIFAKTKKGEIASHLLLKAKVDRGDGSNCLARLFEDICAKGYFSMPLMRLILGENTAPVEHSTKKISAVSYCSASSLTGSSIHEESITEANGTSLQTKHSMESDLDMTQISNDNMTYVTQELLKLKPDIVMEMTVMNSEVMKELANAKDEILGLKSQVVNIQAEVSEIRSDVAAIKTMLHSILS